MYTQHSQAAHDADTPRRPAPAAPAAAAARPLPAALGLVVAFASSCALWGLLVSLAGALLR
jgi:hypothetical protein